jgi:DNA mismatch endonuclease (patch repair protein)
MVDNRTSESRSALMSRIRSKDTAPELTIRRLLHARGYRFRLHLRHLPGRPDIVFSSRRKVIFVNGCFWHGHGCRIGKLPKSRNEFWEAKIEANRARDLRNRTELDSMGWEVLTIWQCDIRSVEKLGPKLFTFLGPPGKSAAEPT